jgi:ribosomal-protein-alanine N-acetyltransferase
MQKIKEKREVNNLLDGGRVFLRSPNLSDSGEFIALNKMSGALHRGLASPPTQAQQFRDYLKKSRRSDCEYFLICHKQNRAVMGAINLSQIVRGLFQNAYLGYHIGAPFAAQGYMGEAIEILLRHAFQNLKLHRIEANVQPHNTASIALLKRAGFTKEGYSPRYLKICGRWRDHERWAIIAEDWRAKKPRRTKKPTDNSI